MAEFEVESMGLSSVKKRDFFRMFDPAWEEALTKENIASGWRKTGLWPLNPAVVMKIHDGGSMERETTPISTGSSQELRSSVLGSPVTTQKVRRFSERAKSCEGRKLRRVIDIMAGRVLEAVADAYAWKDEAMGMRETVYREQRKRKRHKTLTEQLRAEGGGGALWFGPEDIGRAKELAQQKERAKEELAIERGIVAEDRELQKAEKELEIQQRRVERDREREAKRREAVMMRAHKESEREAKRLQKRLEKDMVDSQKASEAGPSVKKARKKEVVVIDEVEEAVEEDRTSLKSGRIVRRRRHFDEI